MIETTTTNAKVSNLENKNGAYSAANRFEKFLATPKKWSVEGGQEENLLCGSVCIPGCILWGLLLEDG